MSEVFSKLETTILKAKGLGEEQLLILSEAGIASKTDFSTVGDAATLSEITGLTVEVSENIMAWAVGAPTAAPTSQPQVQAETTSQPIIIDSADTVHCQHCSTKQPKDYKSGDLCPSCGNQAETMQTCYWCANTGPGKFCRSCGAKFVQFSDLELALQLRREGHAKDEIAVKLAAMPQPEKDTLWARIRARN